MSRYRWAIPAALGVICLILAFLSVALSRNGSVGKVERLMRVGETVSTKSLKLEKGTLYELRISPSRVPLNENYEISATLVSGDNVVFEVVDSYWHERGVWREGGESGTWEEKNASTTFQFRVPETDTYDLEMSLDWTNGPQTLPVRAAIIWREPWLLSMWPLLLGGLFLFGFAGWTAKRGGKAQAKYLMTIGPGSKITIGDHEYEVIERSEHWESGARCGVELRLRDPTTGADRYLSVTGWWEEYTVGEEDYERTLQQIYIGVKLTDDEQERLQKLPVNQQIVELRGQRFYLDKDNSGMGTMATERDGEVYRSDYYNYAYRVTSRIPRYPGENWLECTQWRDDNRTVEWWLSKLVDWKEVEVVEHVDARMIHAFELQSRPSDPFGVRSRQASDPFGVGENAASQHTFKPPMQTPGGAGQSPQQNQQAQQDQQDQQDQQSAWQNQQDNDPKDWN